MIWEKREFYNKIMQEWLDNNNILMCLTHDKGKPVIAEGFIKHWNLKSTKNDT